MSITLQEIFEKIVAKRPATNALNDAVEPEPKRCWQHSHALPCPQCETDKARGYQVLQLVGRRVNGYELDAGKFWHAVRTNEIDAVCGAKYGRRSAGWSSYSPIGQVITCKRCLKKLAK